MLHRIHKPVFIKRYARFILALFVLSVLNISMQAPAHAMMKMQMQKSVMQAVPQCHCPPVICDSVLALDHQSSDGAVSLSVFVNRSVIMFKKVDQNAEQTNQEQHIEQLFLHISLGSPPRLLVNTLLLI